MMQREGVEVKIQSDMEEVLSEKVEQPAEEEQYAKKLIRIAVAKRKA